MKRNSEFLKYMNRRLAVSYESSTASTTEKPPWFLSFGCRNRPSRCFRRSGLLAPTQTGREIGTLAPEDSLGLLRSPIYYGLRCVFLLQLSSVVPCILRS